MKRYLPLSFLLPAATTGGAATASAVGAAADGRICDNSNDAGSDDGTHCSSSDNDGDDNQSAPSLASSTSGNLPADNYHDEPCPGCAVVEASLTPQQVYEGAVQGFAYVHTDEEQEVEECRDREQRCDEWADQGDCLMNAKYMSENCPKACHVCFQVGTVVVDYGVTQITNHPGDDDDDEAIDEETIQNVILDSHRYFVHTVLTDDNFSHVRRDCYNFDAECAYYAALDWCDSDVPADARLMQEYCAVACRSCMMKEYWYECGATDEMKETNALPPVGGVVTMMERVIEKYDNDKITAISYPESRQHVVEERRLKVDAELAVDWSVNYTSFKEWMKAEKKDWIDVLEGGALDHEKPWVLTLDDFLTDEECDFFIHQGHRRGFDRSSKSSELDDSGLQNEDGTIDEGRTSTNTYCDERCQKHPIGKRVPERMSALVGLPLGNSEELQLVKYEVGEHYEEHHDTGSHFNELYCGHRVLTFFLYLNDVCDEEGEDDDKDCGGETRLNTLNRDVKPERGTALIWPSVLNDDATKVDDWGWHQALPIKKGRKYGANAWYHMRNYQDYDTDYDACM